jgi:hypothetical protein
MILGLFREEIGFEKIEGYDNIKDIVVSAVDAEDNYNLLFTVPEFCHHKKINPIYHYAQRRLRQEAPWSPSRLPH